MFAKRYHRKEPQVALFVMLPYIVLMNIVLFGSCTYSNFKTFIESLLYTGVYLFLFYSVCGVSALLIRKRFPKDADLFKRIAVMLLCFYLMNIASVSLLIFLYTSLPLLPCSIQLQLHWLIILIGCLMSTITTFVNEGFSNWEKWKAAIAETEEFRTLSLIAKETINAVALVELTGEISWINQAFTKIMGYTADEAIGQWHGNLLKGDEADSDILAQIHDDSHEVVPFEGEIKSCTKEGHVIWLQISVQLMRDKAGKAVRYFIILTDITVRKMLEFEIKAQLKKTTAIVIATQERERAVVGQELHDNINQVLTTIKLYNELCLSDTADRTPLLTKSVQLLQSSIDEIRNLSKRLSAPSLGKMKLCESVKELAQTIITTNQLSITMDISGIEELDVDHELHINIYRLLQEHLTNILKHAEAKMIEINMDFIDGVLSLVVIDDGKGFDPKQKRTGIGITNIITRAESLNGTIAIDSNPGKGCVLTVHFPLSVEC